MQNKLQALTEQLYNEGLAKGREEGERVLEAARAEAASIIEAAKAEAEAIVARAGKDAAALREKTEADVRMAATQVIQTLKKDIEGLVIMKEGDRSFVRDPEFLKKVVAEVAARFSVSEGPDIFLVLPESLKASLEPWVHGELSSILGAPAGVEFSGRIEGGFTIAPADRSYYISFSDKAFDEMFAALLRPATRKLLFGE